MKIPDSGFNEILKKQIKSKPTQDPCPEEEQKRQITNQEGQGVKEAFRLYTRHLIQIIDKESLPI